MTKAGVFSIIVAVFVSLPAVKAHAFMDGQNFACPIESGATIGQQNLGQLINQDFHIVTSSALGGSAFKAAFALAVFVMIVKFAFGKGQESFVEFVAYFLIAGALVAPVPGAGKSILLLGADMGDSIFQNIVQQIGGLDNRVPGGGAGALAAFNTSLQAAAKDQQANMNWFNKNCYGPVTQLAAQSGIQFTGPTDPALDNFTATVSNQSVQSGYNNLVIEPPTWAMKAFTPLTSTPGQISCSDLKKEITSNLGTAYSTTLQAYQTQLNLPAGSPAGQLFSKYQLSNGSSGITPDEVFKDAFAQSSARYSMDQTDLMPSWLRRIVGNAPGEVGQGGYSWGDISRGFATSPFRLVMMELGELFVFIFDYYIYNMVSVIKMFSAMGMAFGILYYMWFKRLDLPLGALGVWLSANGFYVVAAIALDQFYKKADYTVYSTSLTIGGAKNALQDALFTVALMGTMSTVLAGLLSWKGASFAMHHFARGGDGFTKAAKLAMK
ncbi:MAG: hypothetical protein ACHQ0Y_14550 [Thermodesulfovibrionales bacterium]